MPNEETTARGLGRRCTLTGALEGGRRETELEGGECHADRGGGCYGKGLRSGGGGRPFLAGGDPDIARDHAAERLREPAHQPPGHLGYRAACGGLDGNHMIGTQCRRHRYHRQDLSRS